jgi:large subunit ribosomal protein L30
VAKLKITLTRSLIGRTEEQKNTVKALGLHKTNSTVVQEGTPVIRGMIRKVEFLLNVEEIAE